MNAEQKKQIEEFLETTNLDQGDMLIFVRITDDGSRLEYWQSSIYDLVLVADEVLGTIIEKIIEKHDKDCKGAAALLADAAHARQGVSGMKSLIERTDAETPIEQVH